MNKPWSVDQFEQYRPHMCAFVISKMVPIINNPEKKRLLIHGEVKVGKREIVEFTAIRDASLQPQRIHIFISAFHRTADDYQRDELDDHGITVFTVYNKKKKKEAIAFIMDQLDENPDIRIIIHWDECDYGAGKSQNLSNIFEITRDHERILNIMYSATPEELLYSEEMNENSIISVFYKDGIVLKYDPPDGYCGARRFLDEGLVFQATPFFELVGHKIILSEQAKKILADCKASVRIVNRKRRELQNDIEDAEDIGDNETAVTLRKQIEQLTVRNIIHLRITYSLGDDDDDEDGGNEEKHKREREKAIYAFLRKSQYVDELKHIMIIADKPSVKELQALPNIITTNIEWSKPLFWNEQRDDKLIIIVNDQTSTRSTEWACHHRIYATHDYRKKITFNTSLQADGRSFHYEQKYGGFQPIRIFGDIKTFQFATKQITSAEYLNNSKTKMSQRVKGTSKQIPVIYAKFYPCEPGSQRSVLENIKNDCELVDGIIREPGRYPISNYVKDHTFKCSEDLFSHKDEVSGRYQGNIRGYKVLQFEEIRTALWGIKDQIRLTVCYNGDDVGLCLRFATGKEEEDENLETVNSMYQGKR